MKNNQIIMAIVAVIIVGVAGFFGGMKYQQSQRASFAQGFGGGGYFRGGFPRGSGQGRGLNGMAVVGKVISSDNGSITVQLNNGSSKIVVLPSSATISKSTAGSVSDLQTGTNVAVFGTTNSDGSVTAQNVQINPIMRGGRSPIMSPAPTQ